MASLHKNHSKLDFTLANTSQNLTFAYLWLRFQILVLTLSLIQLVKFTTLTILHSYITYLDFTLQLLRLAGLYSFSEILGLLYF